MPLPDPFVRGPSRAGWLVGLPALALVWAGASLYAAPRVAAVLEAEGAGVAATTAAATGEPWLRLAAHGRDLVAMGEAPDVAERETAMERLSALVGPRRIVSEVGTIETVAPFLWSATRTGPSRIALEGSRPAEIGRRALAERIADAVGPDTEVDDAARAARGAPAGFPEAARFLAARLDELADGGRAALGDTVLSLSGEARDVPTYDALRAALARPPDGFTVGRIDVLPPTVADFAFAVERSAAGVTLRGFAATEAAGEAARGAAREVAAGAPIDDRLRVARGLDPRVDPVGLVAFVFRLAGLIQAGRVAFADGAVAVAGDAIDAQAIPEAAALLRDARPPGVAAGRLALTERPLSPYHVAIRRTAEGVTVTGHLPDAAARERVLSALRPRLFREALIDRSRLAEGAPRDLAAVLAAATPMLAMLAAGEVAVSDRTLRLTGESLYREAAARSAERLTAILPPDWTGSAAVSLRDAPERRGPEACRQGFSAATDGTDLRFSAGSAALAPAFYPVLDALAALARACPALHIAVSGPADPGRPRPSPGSLGVKNVDAEAATAPPAAPEPVDPGASAARAPGAEAGGAGAMLASGQATAPPSHGTGAPASLTLAPKGPASGSARTESGKTESAKTEIAKTEIAKSDTVKSDHAKSESAKLGPAKPNLLKPASPRTDPSKADPAAPARSPKAAGKPAPASPGSAEAAAEPPADLPRQRALALIEYLLQAGARPDQVVAGPDGPAGRAAFALLP